MQYKNSILNKSYFKLFLTLKENKHFCDFILNYLYFIPALECGTKFLQP